MAKDLLRHDWQLTEILALLDLPLNDLIYQAQTVYRQFFNPNQIQLCSLLNIKTGGCPEDCAYCPQSAHYETGVANEKMMDLTAVLEAARQAKERGASRFCLGAAWRQPNKRDFKRVLEMIKAVKSLGVETCATLGILDREQAWALRGAGLDFYNHNLDTSAGFYRQIISTRHYHQRLETLEYTREAGLKVCCGGIIGLGENRADRAALLMDLANLPIHPESVPINQLVKIAGTPLAETDALDSFEIVRCIAAARITLPASTIRLAAGRKQMSDALQALCFLAGANSIFYGEKLLTTPNAEPDHDQQLLRQIGLSPV